MNVPNKKFDHLIGKVCDITVGSDTWVGQVLSFAGSNSVNHDVVTTSETRYILYVDDWDTVKIVLAKKIVQIGN